MAGGILKLQTLVIFASSKNALRNLQNFRDFPQDKIIITQQQQWHLRELFSGNILSIVFLEDQAPNKQLLNILKHSLDRWELKKMLIITESSRLKPQQKWLELFQWLHAEGFWNSLIMNAVGNTLAMDHFSLQLLTNTLTVEQFFHLTTNWLDLKGYQVHFSMANNPPRALIYYDHENQPKLKGYYGSLIYLFAEVYNASLVPHRVSDLDYYSELECLKYVKQNVVDLCGDGMVMSPHYVVTNPEEIASSYLVVPYDKPLPRFLYFLKPFQGSLWCLILFTFIYNIATLAFIHRVQHGSWLFSFQLQYAVLSFIHLPFELKKIKGSLRRYLEILLIFKGFVVSNWYLSLLASLLYTRLYSHDINSLQDLQCG
ncbi:uncharacterized protein LOC135958717 [Calliphora vicina]|uniref:uncharacterized protein LOC135958717 n=1 Tax=Calliphora vicina TaxID=7373 RepID=UPI00325A8125